MIRVTIEMFPKGDESRKTHLGTVDIWNDLSGTSTQGNYKATLSQKGQPDRTWKAARVEGFPRKRLGAYDLLFRVLKQVVSERNAETKVLTVPCSSGDHTVCCNECGTHADPHRSCILR